MDRVLTGLLLACSSLVIGCAPRPSMVAVPTVEVAVRGIDGRPLATTDADPRDDERVNGEKVDVEWRGSWWPAILVERRGSRWLVHYEGYGTEWDEVVGIERIRDRRVVEDEPVIEPMDEDVDP